MWRYGWGHVEGGARRQSRAGTVTVAARDKTGREWVGIGFFELSVGLLRKSHLSFPSP